MVLVAPVDLSPHDTARRRRRMVTFQNISRSTGRKSVRVATGQTVRVRHLQALAAEVVLGRPLRGRECVHWLSETQAVICTRTHAALLQKLARAAEGRRNAYDTVTGTKKRVHVAVAERALGKPLPVGAEVHHVDGDKWNNANENLVICQDHAYHALLHVRARVVRLGGNPNTQRTCADCKQMVGIEHFPRNGNQCRPCVAKRASAHYYRTRQVKNPRRFRGRIDPEG